MYNITICNNNNEYKINAEKIMDDMLTYHNFDADNDKDTENAYIIYQGFKHFVKYPLEKKINFINFCFDTEILDKKCFTGNIDTIEIERKIIIQNTLKKSL